MASERIVSNAAPATLATLMPAAAAGRLARSYLQRPSSISLFALTLGLSRPPREFGVTSYSTQLLPPWMTRLSDYAQGTSLMADEPGDRMPPLAIVDYAAIDSGVPAPPYVLSIFGPDRLSNWEGLDVDGYRDKRARWQDAMVRDLDGEYPGSGRRGHRVVVQYRVFGAAISQRPRGRGLRLRAVAAGSGLAPARPLAAHAGVGPLSGIGLCRVRRLHRRGRSPPPPAPT